MADKYIFKILDKDSEIIIFIETSSQTFVAKINETNFNLPYLKNKDLGKFISKVIDKFDDNTLKLNYTLNLVDANNLFMKIMIWDGTPHTFDISFKSKEIFDNENTNNKINNACDLVKKELNTNLLNLERKFDDECDDIRDKFDFKINETKVNILDNYKNDNFRNFKYKSIKVIKSSHKSNRFFEIMTEVDTDSFKYIPDSFYIDIYTKYSKSESFMIFARSLYNHNTIIDDNKKVNIIRKFFMDNSLFNNLEMIFNYFGFIHFISINIEFNRGTSRFIFEIKFLYDDSIPNKFFYKVYSSLINTEINSDGNKSKLLYHNTGNPNKKNDVDLYIFQSVK